MKLTSAYIFVLALLIITIFISLADNPPDMKRGESLFIDQCSKCHRKSGSGVKDVYPPLKNADYVQKGDNIELIRGMIYGREGRIVVNGIAYQGVMTTEIDKSLTDSDIALILNYVYQKLNGMNKTATEKDVKAARKAGKLPRHK